MFLVFYHMNKACNCKWIEVPFSTYSAIHFIAYLIGYLTLSTTKAGNRMISSIRTLGSFAVAVVH